MRPAQQAIIDEFEVRPRIDPAAELGLRYDDIDDHLEGHEVPVEVAEKIETIWWRTRHTRATPVTPADSWWST